MRTWSELSMAEKADVMKLAIEGGVYDLDSIRYGYNEYAKGGKIHIDPSKKGTFTAAAKKHGKSVQAFASQVLAHPENSSPAMRKKANFARNAAKWHELGGNLFKEGGDESVVENIEDATKQAAHKASTWLMGYIRNVGFGGIANPFRVNPRYKDVPAQNTFLLPRKLQEEIFLKEGYTKGKEGDYGLVKKAVGDNDYPVYQRKPDTISRDKLIVLGNTYDQLLSSDSGVAHGGNVPSAIYTDGVGNFYQKQWDLNDYGGDGGSTAGLLGTILDKIGSPTVVTSGFQPIEKDDRNIDRETHEPKWVHALRPMMDKKGLVPTVIDGKTEWTLPEVTVVGKRRKHGLGGNLFEMGGPRRPAKRNRFADMSIEELKEVEKANEEYWERRQKELDNRTPEQIRQMGIEADKEYRKRNPNNGEADPNLQRSAGVVMSALSDIANSTPFTGSEVAEAAEAQRQKKLDKAHELKMGLDATMTAAEFLAAGYGVTRGLTHLNRYMARQATQSTGQAISRDAMRNLAKWNRRVAQIDKPQVLMNGIGGTADAYQWYTADNNFDAWENGLETGANTAGVVGGMNWFRDLPYLRRIGGDKIDAVLDGMGYSAATWDIVKNLPPLSTVLEAAREESKR